MEQVASLTHWPRTKTVSVGHKAHYKGLAEPLVTIGKMFSRYAIGIQLYESRHTVLAGDVIR